MAMPTDALTPPDLLMLAQWLSPAFPTGAFAWSHGVESAELPDANAFDGWLHDVIVHGAGRSDTILLAAAWRDPAGADGLDALARTYAPSAERLAETVEQGAAFAATVAAIWGIAVPSATLPVAIGVAARARALPLVPAAWLALHAFAANLTAAATRAIPLGQTAAQAVLAGHAATIASTAALALTQTIDDLGGAVFAVDIAAMRHEIRPSRMFRS